MLKILGVSSNLCPVALLSAPATVSLASATKPAMPLLFASAEEVEFAFTSPGTEALRMNSRSSRSVARSVLALPSLPGLSVSWSLKSFLFLVAGLGLEDVCGRVVLLAGIGANMAVCCEVVVEEGADFALEEFPELAEAAG